MTAQKFNRSNIFTAAWNLVKTTGLTLSAALKNAWAAAKAPVTPEILFTFSDLTFAFTYGKGGTLAISKVWAKDLAAWASKCNWSACNDIMATFIKWSRLTVRQSDALAKNIMDAARAGRYTAEELKDILEFTEESLNAHCNA